MTELRSKYRIAESDQSIGTPSGSKAGTIGKEGKNEEGSSVALEAVLMRVLGGNIFVA